MKKLFSRCFDSLLSVRCALHWALLLILGFASSGHAQLSRYTFAQTSGTYVPLTGGTVVATAVIGSTGGPPALNGLVYSLPAGTIPFAFVFNGRPYTSFYLTTSGYITFGATTPPNAYQLPPQLFYQSISTNIGYEGVIAAMGSNLSGYHTYIPLTANIPGEIRYQTLGTAPNRTFVVQWAHFSNVNASEDLNFQIRLHETSNVIDLSYGPTTVQLNAQMQVGLRDIDNNEFVNRTGTWAATTAGPTNAATLPITSVQHPTNGLRYTYTPGSPLPCAQPHSQAVGTVTGTTAVVRWQVDAGSGPFTVTYGLRGFDPATAPAAQIISGITGTSTTITGLSPLTAYDYYVTQNCGGPAGSSPRSNPPGHIMTTLLNDDPSGAFVLPLGGATCTPVAGTNVGAITTVPNGYVNAAAGSTCGSARQPLDVWYKFTTAASGPASVAVQVNVTGPPAGQVQVFSSATGAAGPFTLLGCVARPNYSTPTVAPLVVAGLSPGTTYYVRVANYFDEPRNGNEGGPFTICLTDAPACGTPSNLTATNLTATGAQLTFTPGSGTPSSYNVTLTLNPFRATPGPTLAPITVPATSPIVLTGLITGMQYRATVQANCGAAAGNASVSTNFVVPNPNEDPSGAIALPVGTACTPVSGFNDYAYNTGLPFVYTPCFFGAGDDLWYTFTTAASGPASTAVRLRVTGGPAGSVGVYSSTGGGAGPFTRLFCSQGATPGTVAPPLDAIGLAPNTTYYVRVASYNSLYTGTFTVCATLPPTCGNPLGLGITQITTTSAYLTFIGGTPAAGSYRITLTPQGGSPVLSTAPTSQVQLTSLTPATNYTVSVQGDCGAGGLSDPETITFRTLGAPANDLCAGALPLACGLPVQGTTLSATLTGEPTGSCNGVVPNGPGVWYRFVGTGDDIAITTCAANSAGNDPRLFVYTGGCGALVCVTGNDDAPGCTASGLASTVRFSSVVGTTYYVLVVCRASVLGTNDFTLTATCTPLASRAETLAAQVSLYPNPATQSAMLALPAGLLAQPASLTLLNALGQAVQARDVPAAPTATRLPLDLRGLPAGVYSVRLATGQGPVTKRLVVQ